MSGKGGGEEKTLLFLGEKEDLVKRWGKFVV